MGLEGIIENIALRLPELPRPPRKNLFQILGVQSKETLNSRILAYYFNPKEDHGLGLLFFNSLQELIAEKCNIEIENYSGEFFVFTEDSTSRIKEQELKYKSIDISIDGKDWSIIIENKLNHHLDNPLDVYWDHKKEDFKKLVGIILSLRPIPEKKCTSKKGRSYINITHQELVRQVQSNLNMEGGLSHTSLIYLYEYFKNIQTHYETKIAEKPMNEIVKALNNQGKEVLQIQNKVDRAVEYIDNQVLTIFENNGYERKSSGLIHPQSNHQIRFWVNGGREIILNNEIRFVIESFSQTDLVIRNNEKEFFDFLQKKSKSNPFFTYGNTNGSRTRTHLVKYSNENFLGENDIFSEKFEELLNEYFFEKGGIVDVIEEYLSNKLGEINKEAEINE
ncbi:PD-(D/E)XK nuclease family protein [Gillisia sp. Hel_I_29]|uniref:PD-(D/E)XK nuclease family protein n=1 Tax=Gillisia sp. Hel_I_29 TaxID=1249975 RepID=UPI00054ECFAA|nr:PD-(D/E)XK nuclease family protein [Gillisia sp. Hel_I_29]